MSKMKQPGLDGRHRDESGQISRTHNNTLVRTLRETYGEKFAEGTRSDAQLGTVLKNSGETSLTAFLKDK